MLQHVFCVPAVYVCVGACVCVCVCAHVWMCIGVHVYMYVHMGVRMCACVYACVGERDSQWMQRERGGGGDILGNPD